MTRTHGTIGIIGCGWLGTAVAAQAAADGRPVVGTTTTPEKLSMLGIRGVDAHLYDVSSGDALPAALSSCDVVFLNVPPGRGDAARRAVYPDWMEGVARRLSPQTRLIFASSTSVYPNLNRDVFEDDASEVAGEAAAALLAAEKRVRSVKPEAVILRFGGLYGYDRQPGRFFAGKRGIAGGEAPVNMVHRDDAAAVVLRVAEQDVRGATFSVCADAHPSRSLFYRVWAERGGFDPPQFDRDPSPWKRVSNRRLRTTLPYAFRYPDPMLPAP